MELVMQLQSMESLLALGSGLDLEPGTKGNCLVSGNALMLRKTQSLELQGKAWCLDLWVTAL